MFAPHRSLCAPGYQAVRSYALSGPHSRCAQHARVRDQAKKTRAERGACAAVFLPDPERTAPMSGS